MTEESAKERDEIRKFWDEQAARFGSSSEASMPDEFLTRKEIEQLQVYVNDGDRILDVGCGNGYTTLRLAQSKRITIKGIDYSGEMIMVAAGELERRHPEIVGTVSFEVGDVLEVHLEPPASYDTMICKRVLINLVSWKNQKRAIEGMHKALKRGGILLLSEASKQGWERMNELRKAFYLDEIAQPWHNLYLDEHKLFPFIAPLFDTLEVVNFSSTYYIGSRIVQPFILKICDPQTEPNYNSEINRLFSMLPSYGDYGTQKLYVLAKK